MKKPKPSFYYPAAILIAIAIYAIFNIDEIISNNSLGVVISIITVYTIITIAVITYYFKPRR